MKDIEKKINDWRIEARSPRNDGWVSAHYKNLLIKTYNLSRDAVESLGLLAERTIDDGTSPLLPQIEGDSNGEEK